MDEKPRLDDAQRALLLRIARGTLEQYLRILAEGTERPGEQAVREALRGVEIPEALQEPGGIFVTLETRDGDLRGCVGYPSAVRPLFLAAAECAIAAGARDPRFEPVRPEELPGLRLECSVLSPMRPATAEEVVAGTHGVLVHWSGFSGLLLPQVAAEHGWDRETFLRMACRKAGIPEGFRDRVRIEVFTAEVFREPG
jgi:AmmeMemoRadiSam system protein A